MHNFIIIFLPLKKCKSVGRLWGFVVVLFSSKIKKKPSYPRKQTLFSHFGIVLHYVLTRPHRSLMTAHALLCMLNGET